MSLERSFWLVLSLTATENSLCNEAHCLQMTTQKEVAWLRAWVLKTEPWVQILLSHLLSSLR